jgi:hypothetical protein
MSYICWNCRGAGNASTVRELREIAKNFAPTVLCILETQIDKARVESLASSVGFDNAYAINSVGRSGGIGLFWNKSIKLEVLGYSDYHVDVAVREPGVEPWRMSVFYGEAQTHLRHQTWDTLKNISNLSDLPWLCIGDFNEVLRPDEHEGVGQRSNAQIQAFRDAVDVCMLVDIGFKGRFWTFEKKVAGGSYTRVRLDRALGSAEWCALFPNASLTHLEAATSDHCPIHLELNREQAVLTSAPKIFRYEVAWETHESLKETIQETWSASQPSVRAEDVKEKLARLSNILKRWDRDTFGSVRTEIKNLKKELGGLRAEPMRTGPSFLEQKINERLVELYHREELLWRQRSRIEWLNAGDKNTKFFHLRASMRRKKNMIKALSNALGIMVDDPAELKELVSNFYKDLYKTEGVTNMEAVLEHVPCKVTPSMNDILCAPYSADEVKAALFQMFPTKSPGPDGFPAHFYQRHWDVCGEEVTRAVLRIVKGEESAESINETFLVLIPKVMNPTLLTQFRPISLCNVLYKIASKVVANRLKQILPDIISEEQSAFVPGRLITDNIICAYECLHFMKRSKAKSNSHCALKLDMMKAYDRLEWPYLEAILGKLGFAQAWIDVVMGMIKSVSFSVLFNGEKLDQFKPTRGIRQGDPISPYLFLIAAEGLSCLLKSVSQSSHFVGVQVAPTAPVVNHLLFADDSLLLFKASNEGANEVSNLLTTYCNASGQRVNNEKSSIFFSKGCPQSVRDGIKNSLNVHNEQLSERYLGMPTDVGHSRNGTFKYLRDRVWEKIKGWMEKLLSYAGKEVLIKAVAQAIPVYSMACFRLPRGICENVTSLIRQFWWGSKRGKRKPCWVSWDVCTKPKSLGGLGFRDIELFNLSLLARQAWRLIEGPMTLSARILKSVYYPSVSFLDSELGAHPSQIWRAILDGRDVVAQGIIKRIGTGEDTSIWEQNWIPRSGLMRPICSLVPQPPLLVSELIDASSASWREEELRRIFVPIDVEEILQIPLCTKRIGDFWAWGEDCRGKFSVSSAYKMLSNVKRQRENLLEGAAGSSASVQEQKAWTSLWNIKVPSKLKNFIWRLCNDSIPTADVLHHRHMAPSFVCSFCSAEDSWKHALIECVVARCVWSLSTDELNDTMRDNLSLNAKNWMFMMHEKLPHDVFTRMVVTLWALWRARRRAMHEDIYDSPLQIHHFVNAFMRDIQILSTPKQSSRRSLMSMPSQWLPPPPDHAKLNVDAAVLNDNIGAAAVVCRDINGAFLGASAITFKHIHNPVTLEALAVREALAIAEDLYLQQIHVASDCKKVVDDIKRGSSAEHAAIILEITDRSRLFIACNITHEFRSSNFEAHNLARHALSLGFGRHVWLGQPGDLNFIPVNVVTF